MWNAINIIIIINLIAIRVHHWRTSIHFHRIKITQFNCIFFARKKKDFCKRWRKQMECSVSKMTIEQSKIIMKYAHEMTLLFLSSLFVQLIWYTNRIQHSWRTHTIASGTLWFHVAIKKNRVRYASQSQSQRANYALTLKQSVKHFVVDDLCGLLSTHKVNQ